MEILKEFSREVAPIHIMCRLLRRDTLKLHNYILLPPFLGYAVTFVLVLFLQRVDIDLSTSSYVSQSIEKHRLRDTAFVEAKNFSMWWDWLEGTISQVADATMVSNAAVSRGVVTPILPLDLVMVRQIRVGVGNCEVSSVLDPITKARIGSKCAKLHEPSERAVPFGPGLKFVPNFMRRSNNSSVSGIKRLGYIYDFTEVENEFVELFYLSDAKDDLLAQLRQLKADGFVDVLTRGLVVDAFSYFANQDRVIVSSFAYEVSRSGMVHATTAGHLMNGFDLKSPMKRFVLVLDILLFVETLLFFVSLMHELHQKKIIEERWYKVMQVWELFTLVMGCLIFAACVKRFQAYALDWDRRRDHSDVRASARAFATAYITLNELFSDIFDIMSFALLFFGMKLLFFLQHVAGLNIITATLRECIDDLIALGTFAFVLLAVYATAGVVIFGHVFEPMRTVWHSVTYLVRAAISAELNEYNIFHNAAPAVTYLYFGTFFVFFWILVLNLTLGVTSAAFLDAAQSRDHDSALEVFMVFFLLRGPIFEIDRHTHGKIEAHQMSWCVRAASQALKLRGSFLSRLIFLHTMRRTKRAAYVVLRDELKLHREVSEAMISRERLAELLPEMDPCMRNAVFNEAMAEARRNVTTRSVAERRHERLMRELTTINRQAIQFQLSLDTYRTRIRGDTVHGSMHSRARTRTATVPADDSPRRGFHAHETRPLSRSASILERRKSVTIDCDDLIAAESASSSFSDASDAEVLVAADDGPVLPLLDNDSIAAVVERLAASADDDLVAGRISPTRRRPRGVLHVPAPLVLPERTPEEMAYVASQLAFLDDTDMNFACNTELAASPPAPDRQPPPLDYL